MRKAVVFWVALFAATGCGGAEVKVGTKTGDDGGHMGKIDSNSRCELGDGMREALVDLNQDKNPDVRKVYAQRGEAEVLVCREADLNFDGLKDIFYYFDEDGAPKRDEVDLDYDGVIDIVSTYASGKIVKQELDTNSDAQIDRVRFLEDGLPSRLEADTDGDGKVDYWEYYEAGKLIRVGMDTDGDGRADNWNRDEPEEPEEEAEEAGEGEAEGEGDEGEAAEEEASE